MKIRYCIFRFLTLFFSSATATDQTVCKSTSNNKMTLAVTVYNNNISLIKDIRRVKVPPGKGELRFMDVASHIMPVTVHAKSLNNSKGFMVLEQNYEYDLMNADKLLDKYVGKKSRS